MITDFTKGQDRIGLKNGLTFINLNIDRVGQDTVITENGTDFGDISLRLKGVNASSINATDFVSLSFDKPALLFVQDATSGNYDASTGRLTLQGVSDSTLAFSDRPYRLSYNLNTARLSQSFATSNFREDPPNAVLNIGAQNVTVELLEPTYNPASQTLVYNTRILQGTIPSSFGKSSLFIDDSSSSSPIGAVGAGATLAKTIFDNLDTRENFYSYEDVDGKPATLPRIKLDKMGKYITKTDCSGFVSYVLSKSMPAAYQAVNEYKENNANSTISGDKIAWPRAFIYESLFSSLATTPQPSWTAVTNITQVQPGDIIAWCLGKFCLPDGQGSANDTGHVMVVADRPTQVLPIPPNLPDSAVVWSVPVYDSSSLRHHSYTLPDGSKIEDTRIQPNRTLPSGEKNGGVGTGAIYFAVDANGQPLGFQFGPKDSFNFNSPTSSMNISIGRPVS